MLPPIRSACAALPLLALFSLAGCGDSASNAAESDGTGKPTAVFKFTAIPDTNTTELRAKFEPVAAYLSDQLGVAVEYVPSANYQSSVEFFKNGDVHAAWFGGVSGIKARAAVPGARAIAQGQEDLEFTSYFIAHRDTGLTRSDSFPEGIAGKTLTFGSKGSTSGRYMPEHFIRENTGKNSTEFTGSQPLFSESHDTTCEWVASGQAEVGALNYQVYDERVANGETDPEVVRVIWQTPTYADYNLTAHPELDKMFGAGFIDKLQKTLLEMNDENLLKAFSRSKLVSAKNSDFDQLSVVVDSLDQR